MLYLCARVAVLCPVALPPASQRLVFLSVNVCAVLDEEPNSVRVPPLRCLPQRKVVIGVHISNELAS